MDNSTILTLLASAWIGYFMLHSLLASTALKQRFAGVRCYRLIYNLIALAGLLPVVALYTLYQGEKIVRWSGPWSWLALLLSLAAAACFLWSLRYYDLGEFSGWRRCRSAAGEKSAPRLVISPLHRHVRHPWYGCALVLIWCRDMDLAQLISSVLITLYFVTGSRLEERRLITEHGENYREYRREVPGLLPLPWRSISRERAEALMNPRSTPRSRSPAVAPRRRNGG